MAWVAQRETSTPPLSTSVMNAVGQGSRGSPQRNTPGVETDDVVVAIVEERENWGTGSAWVGVAVVNQGIN